MERELDLICENERVRIIEERKKEGWIPIQISSVLKYGRFPACYVLFERNVPEEPECEPCCGNCAEFWGVEGSAED